MAEDLQAPPLQGGGLGVGVGVEETTESGDDSSDDDEEDDEDDNNEDTEHSNDNEDSASQPECAVCESEPKKVEQVWNLSCGHGFCGGCMLARLSQRERRCMYCRSKIVQVIEGNGQVFQHYDWTRSWARRHQATSSM